MNRFNDIDVNSSQNKISYHVLLLFVLYIIVTRTLNTRMISNNYMTKKHIKEDYIIKTNSNK